MEEGGWCGRVIIVSALSLSLRDKERLRDRESLTTYIEYEIAAKYFGYEKIKMWIYTT